ncbi:PD-(D/E)XK nuclease superfamily protein [Rahnella sp. AA]|uniref:PD-(D/E)XK nuclease family protein n=1 Tax=Rahnella sp. AA TaxID=2057180 RepID=UPI000C34E484|nr:PD-(D/E)XK nuclease family protein [Rahnella sp. AA]PKE28905.1 PD-(D/E)XK nuclease superfamily protein [Rahnella sp. AA]
MQELTEEFFQQLINLTRHKARETNFYTSGGTGYLENPTSDLLALFMGRQHDVPCWLLKALMECLDIDYNIDELDITSLEVTREARTADGKYLDIIIWHQDFLIGIEHKTISAINNPFASYEKHLNSLTDNKQDVYFCIIAPDNLLSTLTEGWPLVKYSKLIAKARNRQGKDQANTAFGKWHIFYSEFLNHLHDLSGTDNTMLMNAENQIFVKDHFTQLLKAQALLKDFEDAMIAEAKKTLAQVLPDTNITQRINNWPGDYKAIHLAPECWGQGGTGVSLVYYPDAGTQTLKYYVNGWINSIDYPELSALHEEVIICKKSADFLPSANKNDPDIYLKNKELMLSFGTNEGSLDEAKILLIEMANFISGTLKHAGHSL